MECSKVHLLNYATILRYYVVTTSISASEPF